jgi:3D (Asp-Asp-Asp) domain-containing protein
MVMVAMLKAFIWLDQPAKGEATVFTSPLRVSTRAVHRFIAKHGYSVKEYNVGVTYYTVGEPTTPGTTMRSGRHVYEGAVAVSRDFITKGRASFGDILWYAPTGEYYVIEDTMGEAATMRIDLFTNDPRMAKSGSRRANVVIIRADKADVRRDHATL